MIIFSHIQKTAGTSVNTMLRNQEKMEVWYKYETPNKAWPDVISGHVPYGAHEAWDIEGTVRYFTFLRDPIKRWKSQMMHGLRTETSVGHRLYNRFGHIEMFTDWCIDNEVASNIMTRQIAGIEDLNNIRRWKGSPDAAKDFGYSQNYGWAARYKTSTDEEMEEMLAIAKRNLTDHFEFIGFQETFGRDFSRLCNHFGFEGCLAPMTNVGDYRININLDSDYLKDKIEVINKYDIELFRFAWELFAV